MSIFFTADTHWGHANIIRFCDRPFKTKQEHDEALIERWNSVVKPGDMVYHLGDLAFGSPVFVYTKILQKLRGQIFLIKGNHDKNSFLKEPLVSRFIGIKDQHWVGLHHKGRGANFFLSHYPHRSWFKSFHGSYHLFGHTHGRLGPHGLSFDVGVDAWNYTPVSFEQVMNKMEELKSPSEPNVIENCQENPVRLRRG